MEGERSCQRCQWSVNGEFNGGRIVIMEVASLKKARRENS